MDVQHLQSFLALADAGSFTKAAARQHLSQPAFSRRIRSLEHWVGADLIDRSTYPVTLTHAGQQLRRRAADLLEGLQQVRDEVRGYRQIPRGAVRVVTSQALAFSFFPRWWRQVFSGSSPSLCKVTACNTLDAYDSLTAGGCDLLLTYVDPLHPVDVDPSEFDHATICTDVFAPYALDVDGKPKFRLPGTARRPVPLLDYGEGAFFGRIVDSILRKTARPLHVETAVVSDLAPGLMSLVLDGMGVAWLPGMLAATAADQIAYAGGATWRRELDVRLYRSRETAGEHTVADQIWQRATRARASSTEGDQAHDVESRRKE